MKKIKHILLIGLFASHINAIDLGGIGGSIGGALGGNIGSNAGSIIGGILGGNGLGSLFNSLNDLSGGAIGMCYYNANLKANIDVCSQFSLINDLQKNMCGVLPDIGGFGKKTNYVGISGAGLQSFCSANVDKLNNAISHLYIYDSEYKLSDNITLPNGKSLDDYYNNVANIKNILGTKRESYAKNVILKQNQNEIKALLDAGKLSNIDSLSDFNPNTLQAPESMSDYFLKRDGLSAAITNDLIIASPSNVSGVLKTKLSGKKGASAEKEANKYVAEINEKIDAGTPKRVGIAIDLARQSSDLAIPTKDYVNIIEAPARPILIAKINNQIKREAYIQSKVVLQDEIRKNLVSLAGQKAVIMNEEFDSQKAEEEINKLIQ